MWPFNWGGRASQREYVATLLLCFVVAAAAASTHDPWRHPFVAAPMAAILTALVAGAILRRMHDAGLSAWRVALPMGAYTAIVLVAWICLPPGSAQRLLQAVASVTGFLAIIALFFVALLIPNPAPNRFGPVPRWTSTRALKPRPREPLGDEAAKVLRRMKRQAQTTLMLRPAEGPSFTKLGGRPDLDDCDPWPISPRGEQLAFIGQFDLAEAHAQGGPAWLPAEGFLYVFALRGGWDVNAWRVIYRPYRTEASLNPPAGTQFPERQVVMTPMKSYPSLDWLGLDCRVMEVEDGELDELADFPGSALADGPQHRIGGYPCELQESPMALMCELAADEVTPQQAADGAPQVRAARKWRLLLQVESDQEMQFDWGGGRLYFFVRISDAQAGDFSKVWMIWQTD